MVFFSNSLIIGKFEGTEETKLCFKEELFMLTMETWWKDIFSGNLAIGLNENKIHQLHDESFLYYSTPSSMFQAKDQRELSIDLSLK